jgi:hypothetical protein
MFSVEEVSQICLLTKVFLKKTKKIIEMCAKKKFQEVLQMCHPKKVVIQNRYAEKKKCP